MQKRRWRTVREWIELRGECQSVRHGEPEVGTADKQCYTHLLSKTRSCTCGRQVEDTKCGDEPLIAGYMHLARDPYSNLLCHSDPWYPAQSKLPESVYVRASVMILSVKKISRQWYTALVRCERCDNVVQTSRSRQWQWEDNLDNIMCDRRQYPEWCQRQGRQPKKKRTKESPLGGL